LQLQNEGRVIAECSMKTKKAFCRSQPMILKFETGTVLFYYYWYLPDKKIEKSLQEPIQQEE
jgi:hypothetical protein